MLIKFLLVFISLFSNAKVLAVFRIADLTLFLFALLTCRLKVDLRLLFVFLVFFIFAFLSSLNGAFNYVDLFKANDFVFYYKYFFFMLCSLILVSVVRNRFNLLRLRRHFIFGTLFLSLYLSSFVFISVLSNLGLAVMGATRVSIPFSDVSGGVSNAPAFSVVLASFFIAVYSLDVAFRFKIIFLGLLFASIFLCGSRSGVVLLFVWLLARSFYDFKVLCVLMLFIFVSSFLLSIFNDQLISGLVSRALNFDLANDASAGGRLFKQSEAFFTIFDQFFLLGVGHENTSITWYDGLFGNLFIFSGLLGSLCFLMFIVLVWFRLRAFGSGSFFSLIVSLSFLSEFVLTSYVVMTLMYLSMLEVSNSLKVFRV